MFLTAISKSILCPIDALTSRGFSNRSFADKKPKESSEITLKVSFDKNCFKNASGNLCYFVPFMSRPRAVIDEKFMKNLEATPKDSIYMVEKKKDLKQYFMQHMYKDYYTNTEMVVAGNAFKWLSVINGLNYYINHGGYSNDDLIFFGFIGNCIAFLGIYAQTDISARGINYTRIFEYNKVKQICQNVD